ncbi:unnamed protein product [Microthlaspi erraticum]|uniref:Zinc finger GRF-type domain-containing protein n=1 Tax=Microthlaspi erraticum TaxID=1685480 RepID=A0A6D2KK82_9BRAS|nr:unnamed protein product [Microthlaspi erraticum]CAA7058139.1 unnamed protein product [Microthlaspi erraticum]
MWGSPSKAAMKEMMREMDYITLVQDGQRGIPKECPCGGRIYHEISKIEGDLGNRYFTCKAYKNDGFHWRVPWFYSVEEEFDKLMEQIDEQNQKLSGLETQLKKMSEELRNQRGVIAKLKDLVEQAVKNIFDGW